MINSVFFLSDFAVYDATGYATDTGPPFVVPDYKTELQRCMRYYEKEPSQIFFSGQVTNGSGYYHSAFFKVTKRIAPTMILTDISNSAFPAGVPSVQNASVGTVSVNKVSNLTLSNGFFIYSYVADARF